MYNLLEYSDNYSMTSGGLRNCYRDVVNYGANENHDDNNRINSNKGTTINLFEYNTEKIGDIPDNSSILVP